MVILHWRSFSLVTPQLWNSLPLEACQSPSLDIFQKGGKARTAADSAMQTTPSSHIRSGAGCSPVWLCHNP
ncbi:hypothetical protein Y1Q_0001548 [Alligator mississippiensis]|uniref:Uncharacterized protein n=1 Tax=Alligator mississippiensis TaxID=8496 RepID=A0A151MA29_ALLMI|nr:hypothetical protein Y1Q_0001548 [Alligator mississippiensis]